MISWYFGLTYSSADLDKAKYVPKDITPCRRLLLAAPGGPCSTMDKVLAPFGFPVEEKWINLPDEEPGDAKSVDGPSRIANCRRRLSVTEVGATES